jgi:hypothetical protein
MTRYYVCGHCAARWQVARDWQSVQDGSADGEGGARPVTL